jgi:Zn-dependent protease with chaperone function
MVYGLFLIIAILYNLRKFSKEKTIFLESLMNAQSGQHREMILSHQFHIFIFEAFLGFVISHVISERTFAMGILGFAIVYLMLLIAGLFLYQYFLKFLERLSGLELRKKFNHHVIKEFRVSFGLIMLPIIIYSLLNWTFQNEPILNENASSFWFIEFFSNFIFISVLTITCTVILLLRLLPNRDITEPEYVELIHKRLSQIGMPHMRVRWIEADIKNAFVVGIKLLRFSNQTMFIGRRLRTMLNKEEFDAVICHELAHVANRHIQKRVFELLKNFISSVLGVGAVILLTTVFFFLYYGEDFNLHDDLVAFVCTISAMAWIFFSYSLFFDSIRSHEYEADAFAVMKLGASLSSLKSALEKLVTPDELPEYVRAKTKKKSVRSPYTDWFTRKFITHPDLVDRIYSVENKIAHGLPFDHYVSRLNKIKNFFALLLQWRVSVPLSTSMIICFVWIFINLKKGDKLVHFIKSHDAKAIMANREIASSINNRPYIIGKNLMFYVVQKRDSQLIDYFLRHGADPGRTMIYIVGRQDFELFKRYYSLYSPRLNQDEYYLVLLESAELNSVETYRYLVNSTKFETLHPDYKSQIVDHVRENQQRRPASEK